MTNESTDAPIELRSHGKKVHYIVADAEGIWMTETPDDDDEILFETADLFTAEQALCREISRCD